MYRVWSSKSPKHAGLIMMFSRICVEKSSTEDTEAFVQSAQRLDLSSQRHEIPNDRANRGDALPNATVRLRLCCSYIGDRQLAPERNEITMENKVAITNSEDFLTAGDLARVSPFVEGKFVQSASDDVLELRDPASSRKLSEIPAGSSGDVRLAVASSKASFVDGRWCKEAPSGKKRILLRWADLIEANASRLDALDALEMGKPVSVPVFNAKAAAGFVRFNAEALDKCSGDVLTSDSSSTVIQTRVPRGVVA